MASRKYLATREPVQVVAVQVPASLIQAWTMSKHFRPWNIDQTLLLPPSVQDFVPTTSRVSSLGWRGRAWISGRSRAAT